MDIRIVADPNCIGNFSHLLHDLSYKSGVAGIEFPYPANLLPRTDKCHVFINAKIYDLNLLLFKSNIFSFKCRA